VSFVKLSTLALAIADQPIQAYIPGLKHGAGEVF